MGYDYSQDDKGRLWWVIPLTAFVITALVVGILALVG